MLKFIFCSLFWSISRGRATTQQMKKWHQLWLQTEISTYRQSCCQQYNISPLVATSTFSLFYTTTSVWPPFTPCVQMCSSWKNLIWGCIRLPKWPVAARARVLPYICAPGRPPYSLGFGWLCHALAVDVWDSRVHRQWDNYPPITRFG